MLKLLIKSKIDKRGLDLDNLNKKVEKNIKIEVKTTCKLFFLFEKLMIAIYKTTNLIS